MLGFFVGLAMGAAVVDSLVVGASLGLDVGVAVVGSLVVGGSFGLEVGKLLAVVGLPCWLTCRARRRRSALE